MQVKNFSSYDRSLKQLTKKDKLLLQKIDETLEIFIADKNDIKIHFKKISCKVDKNRYSIRVINSSYRILLSYDNEISTLVCVCTHSKYDRYNKMC